MTEGSKLIVFVVLADFTGEFVGVFASQGAAKRAATKEGRCHVERVEVGND